MSWSHTRAEDRIRGFASNAPKMTVERYEDDFVQRIVEARITAKAAGREVPDTPPLYDLPDGTAVVVDTVQVYVRPVNFNEVRLTGGSRSEVGDARALSFLHMLYGAGDRVVEDAGAQRVDFHGPRMHGVVIEPRGDASLRERIATGLRLAEQMVELSRSAEARFFSDLGVDVRFRVGIDAGPCVAINSGRSDEREPMFIGPAANHAAKLAMGEEPGIYLSDRVRSVFGLARAGTLTEERSTKAKTDELSMVASFGSREGMTAATKFARWQDDLRTNRTSMLRPDAFTFQGHTPPLRSIDYASLSPSRSIRMPMAAIFADLDEYTRYIDGCMANGDIGEAVRLLHVLRSEFNAVVQSDFAGRKVRFIGDCILGILAEGSAQEVDLEATVRSAVSCAGALRSSFDLCGEILPEARKLGLAIGLETGTTPISRIGIRGDRAVRVATSIAVRDSERCQRECDGRQTMIGPNAYQAGGAAVRSLFGGDRKASELCYPEVDMQLDAKKTAASVAKRTGLLVGAGAGLGAAPARAYCGR